MAKGIRFSFEIAGKAQFDRTFSRLDLHLTDLTETWTEVRDVWWEIEEDQFQSGGAAGASGKWHELSPAYEKIKISKYGTLALLNGVLIASGDLQKAMTGKNGDSVFNASKDEMVIGAGGRSGRIAGYHQKGGGNLPRREVISFSDKTKKLLQKRIQKSLLSQMRGDGWTATENDYEI